MLVDGRAMHVTATPGGVLTARFNGNQVRLIGAVGPDGGLADLYLDGEKQLVHLDCWNPHAASARCCITATASPRRAHPETRCSRRGNPYSKGASVSIGSLQYSAATGLASFPVRHRPARHATHGLWLYGPR